MLTHLGGMDHGVVLVRDLDAAAATFGRLGFTIAPRGTHSPHMGTDSNCVMLRNDYFELLGVLTPTELNARWRRVLETREGISAIALRAHDAEAGAAEIAARGVPALPVQRFGRPVAMPDGSLVETRFNTFHLADLPAPGLRIFACQHLTPEATWVPGLMDHANSAEALAAFEVPAVDLGAAAAGVGRMLDRQPAVEPDCAVKLETGSAPLVFLTAAQLRGVIPDSTCPACRLKGR